MSFIVAIDGPAGTGKGTVTKILSEKTNLINIDTGAMYRCVTLACLNNGVSASEEDKIKKILDDINIEIVHNGTSQRFILNGKDVSEEIRMPRINNNVSQFSEIGIVRNKLTSIQRKIAENKNIIMEGRDIGTAVFPNADVKIYLDCTSEEAARRRYKQNLENGINESYEDVLASIKMRKEIDSNREIAPLKKADDAIVVDSTNMTIDEVVKRIEEIIKKS